jgi:uncharacterized cupin superfamily protein
MMPTPTPHDPAGTRPGWLTLNNRHTGECLHLRRIRRGGQNCLELSGTLPPHRGGPPLHRHFKEDEDGVVVAGTLAAVVDGVELLVEQGGLVRLPKGSAHRWWNGGAEMLQFDGVVTPVVDFDRYVSAVFDVINSGSAQRPPLFYIAHVSWRHRKTQALLIGPRWVQAVLLPAVVLVGTLLGRYRGTDWPGCPARSQVAPLLA